MRIGIINRLMILAALALAAIPQISSGQLRERESGYDFESPGFLSMPGPLAYDSGRHRLAMADKGRNLIHVFSLTDRTYQTLGDREGIEGITGISFDMTGNLYVVAESVPIILRFAFESDFADTIDLGDIPSRRPIKPSKIFIDSNGLKYICDREAAAVYIINIDNTLLKEFSSKLKRPDGISVRQSGEILVADRGVDPILIYSPQGEFLRKLSSPKAPAEQLSISASGLAVDQRGWIYTVDNTRSKVIWYDPTGVNHGEWSEPAFFPEDIVIDRYDNIYISERGSGRVRIFTRPN